MNQCGAGAGLGSVGNGEGSVWGLSSSRSIPFCLLAMVHAGVLWVREGNPGQDKAQGIPSLPRQRAGSAQVPVCPAHTGGLSRQSWQLLLGGNKLTAVWPEHPEPGAEGNQSWAPACPRGRGLGSSWAGGGRRWGPCLFWQQPASKKPQRTFHHKLASPEQQMASLLPPSDFKSLGWSWTGPRQQR